MPTMPPPGACLRRWLRFRLAHSVGRNTTVNRLGEYRFTSNRYSPSRFTVYKIRGENCANRSSGQEWAPRPMGRNGRPGRLKIKAPPDWSLGCSESVDAPTSALGIGARFVNVIRRLLDARAELRRFHFAEFANDQRRNARYVRGSHRCAGGEEILVSCSPSGAENHIKDIVRRREKSEIATRSGDINH